MSKIKKTDITKLSKLEQQIEELKKKKKQQEEDVALQIGKYFMNEVDFDNLNNTDEVYKIIDEVIEKTKTIDNKSNAISENNYEEENEENEILSE